jgi:hypothetical protein
MGQGSEIEGCNLDVWMCGACCDVQEDGQATAVGEHGGHPARGLAMVACARHPAIAAGEARRPLEAKQPTGLACATQHGTSCGVHSLGGRSAGGSGQRRHVPRTAARAVDAPSPRCRQRRVPRRERQGSRVAGPRTQEQREETGYPKFFDLPCDLNAEDFRSS